MNIYNHTVLITARGGSKGLKHKNIYPINGLPLIAWTIKAAQKSPCVERIFVSTDDSDIADISSQFGAEVIQRPNELASDTASSIDVILHAIKFLEDNNIYSSTITLLQPTSPLRTSQHIEEAYSLFINKEAQFVISVFEPNHTPIKAYIENIDGTISGLYSNDAPYSRRQDLPRSFQPNGAIYMFSSDKFKNEKHFPRKDVFPYLMSKECSIDIDNYEDLVIAEKRLKELSK